MIKEQENRPSLAISESWRITFVKQILYKALIKTTLQGVNWNEFQKQNSCQNYAFFWPYFYDPTAPDRPLIQMKNQERGEGTDVSNGPLIATCVQAWDRHCAPETWNVDHTTNIKCKVFRRKLSFLFIETWPEETRNNIKVKTPLSASSDYVDAMNVQQQNLNTVKSHCQAVAAET